MSTISLLLGVAGFAATRASPIIGIILGVAAFILGIFALALISQDREKYGGTGMAIAGIVLGVLIVASGVWFMYFFHI